MLGVEHEGIVYAGFTEFVLDDGDALAVLNTPSTTSRRGAP
jgi:hypothetical protein